MVSQRVLAHELHETANSYEAYNVRLRGVPLPHPSVGDNRGNGFTVPTNRKKRELFYPNVFDYWEIECVFS